jgi:hypothetical protein
MIIGMYGFYSSRTAVDNNNNNNNNNNNVDNNNVDNNNVDNNNVDNNNVDNNNNNNNNNNNGPYYDPDCDDFPAAYPAVPSYAAQYPTYPAVPSYLAPYQADSILSIQDATIYLSAAENALQAATGGQFPPLECWGCRNHPLFHDGRHHRWTECPHKGNRTAQDSAKKGLKAFIQDYQVDLPALLFPI